MADIDHLNFIRIRGLTGNPAEVFQGASGPDGGGSTITSGGGSGGAGGSDWTEIPPEALESISKYTDDINSYIDQVNAQTRSLARSRGSRETTAIAPYVPNVMSTLGAAGAIVATGGAALPAVATVMAVQVGMNIIGQAVQNFAMANDENSPQAIMKKAFLYDESGTQHSILGTALLTAEYESVMKTALQQLQDILDQRLSDLAYVDETIDFGFARLHIKGKMIEY